MHLSCPRAADRLTILLVYLIALLAWHHVGAQQYLVEYTLANKAEVRPLAPAARTQPGLHARSYAGLHAILCILPCCSWRRVSWIRASRSGRIFQLFPPGLSGCQRSLPLRQTPAAATAGPGRMLRKVAVVSAAACKTMEPCWMTSALGRPVSRARLRLRGPSHRPRLATSQRSRPR